MNKTKLFLLSALLCLSLTGCGGKEAKQAKQEKEDKTIKVMGVLMGTDIPGEDSPIHKEIEKLTGYKLDIQWVPDNMYNDKVSITLASKDVPNIVTLKDRNSTTVSNIQNGAFWSLDKYYKNYEYLNKSNPGIKLNSSFNGTSYGVYRGRDLIRNAVIIRKDWLDNLGLKEPTTLEEFKEILREFTENDPDGNGINDTYGLIVPKWPGTLNTNSPFDQMTVWFGAPNVAKVENGKVTPDFMTPEYQEALDFFKEIYDKKYMNNNFATMDSARWEEPFLNGKAGVIIDVQSRALRLQRKMLEKYGDDGLNGDSYVTMVGNVKVGEHDFILPSPGFAGILALPKQGVKDEKEVNKVLDFLNKLNSKEADKLLTIGVEGIHYTMDNGVFNPTTERKLIDEILNYSQLGMNTPNYPKIKVSRGTKLEEVRKEIMANGVDKSVFNPVAPFSTKIYALKGAQLQNIMADARIQYIAGQIDKSGYKAAIDLWLSTGGNEYIEELEKYSVMNK